MGLSKWCAWAPFPPSPPPGCAVPQVQEAEAAAWAWASEHVSKGQAEAAEKVSAAEQEQAAAVIQSAHVRALHRHESAQLLSMHRESVRVFLLCAGCVVGRWGGSCVAASDCRVPMGILFPHVTCTGGTLRGCGGVHGQHGGSHRRRAG